MNNQNQKDRTPETHLSRRQFLGATAKSAAVLGAASTVLISRQNVLGANERLGVGFIGVGGRGRSHVNTVRKLIEAGEPGADRAHGSEDQGQAGGGVGGGGQ